MQGLVEIGRTFELLRLDGAHVERILEDLRHGDHAVCPPVPVVDGVAAHHGGAGLIEAIVEGDGMHIERTGQGHDLHHRARLVEVGNDGIDELRGRDGGKRIGVIAGHVGPGHDPAGLRFHDDQRATLRLVLLHAFGEGALGDHLDGVIKG